MILTHFSAKEFIYNPKMQYEIPPNGSAFSKPNGLWLSDESEFGWAKFCDGSDWNSGGFAYRTDFALVDKSNWLVLPDAKSIMDFTENYRIKDEWIRTMYGIDWARVQKIYDGILITPYHWSARNSPETMWYYGWDCASACVWNLKTIRGIK